ncbi:MAG: recombinase family protein [Chloroflexota bacterium]|nr:recombinase family protein [Chloroflexota bacterium]
MRALLYVRQSRERDDERGGESLSLAMQEARLRAYAGERGWTVAAVEADPDTRGWQEERPGFTRIMARAAAGEGQILLVWDISRFARNLRMTLNALHDLEQWGVRLVSYGEPWVENRLMLHIMGAMAEHRTQEMSSYLKEAMRRRIVHRKLHHGAPPWGLKRGPGGVLVPDEDPSIPPGWPGNTAPIAREVRQRFADGEPLRQIERDLVARGIPSVRGGSWTGTNALMKTLKNPVYWGCVQLRPEGIVVEGAHEPLTDTDTEERIAKRLVEQAGKRQPRGMTMTWLRGHIEHGCGRPMHPLGAIGRNREVFRCPSYNAGGHSSCGQAPRQIAIWKAQDVALACLRADVTRAVHGPAGERLSMEAVAHRLQEQERLAAPLAGRLRQELEDRRLRALERREQAENLYLDKARDRAWFDARDAAIREELAGIERDLASLPSAHDEAAAVETAGVVVGVADLLTMDPEIGGPEVLAGILGEVGTVVVGPEHLWIRYKERYRGLLAMEGAEGKAQPIPPTRGRGRDALVDVG